MTAAAREQGRAAYARRSWREAHEALARADAAAALDADDLELLARAAYMIGREEEFLRALERAHEAHLGAGRPLAAVRCAFWLGMTLVLGGAMGGATGWFGRAGRTLETEPADCPERGYLLVPLAFRRAMSGELEAALAISADAVAIGERSGDRELLALAIFQRGRILVSAGRIGEGIALLDEAMVAATAGELSPILTGMVYCGVILACQEAHEARRAREWTAALSSWCDAQPDMVAFTGRCLLHRAQVMQLGGAWGDALEEAERATARAGMAATGSAEALYLQGEIHRLRGDVAQAEHAYREASRLGREPQPGLALLRLAQGRGEAAAAAMRRAAGEAAGPSVRALLLPACAEIMAALGHLDEARAAAAELGEIAAACASEMLEAAAAQARGTVHLAEGAAAAALPELRRARELWQALDAPYETARAGALVARACRALGDEDTAAFELDSAAAAFRALGAAPDLATMDAPEARAGAGHGLSRRELEVLRLLAAGATNKAIAAELVLSVRTVDRHVSNIFAKVGVSTRAAAGAFAHEHGLT
jgi:DNA-binding CsgD family transcriptional regulator